MQQRLIRAIRHLQRGLGLTEVMVGMLIGMIGVVVMMQVFQTAEGHKRTTTSGGDAQTNGALALHALQRDVRQSGAGISAPELLGCNLTLRSGIVLNAIGPVTINHANIPAGDDNTDTLLVMYGSSFGTPDGDGIVQQPSANVYTVNAPNLFAPGDLVVARPPDEAACNIQIARVVTVTDPTPPNVTVTTGTPNAANGRLYNLGSAPRVWVYAVRNGALTVCDYMQNDCGSAGNAGNQSVWVPLAANIVSLRAQYGHDTSADMTGVVDDSGWDAATPATSCEWSRVPAVRIALLARSDQYEKDEVTKEGFSWSGGEDAAIDISGLPDWKHYRYKLFETLVPLRNIAGAESRKSEC